MGTRLSVLTVLVLGSWVLLALGQEHTKDSLDTVKKAVAEKKALLLDVREQQEWNRGHLESAKLLPLSQLRAGIPAADLEKVLPKGSIIYAHCAAGGRCLVAAKILSQKGYDVRALKPGYESLLKAGFKKAEPK